VIDEFNTTPNWCKDRRRKKQIEKALMKHLDKQISIGRSENQIIKQDLITKGFETVLCKLGYKLVEKI
jgi:hypothetical protein